MGSLNEPLKFANFFVILQFVFPSFSNSKFGQHKKEKLKIFLVHFILRFEIEIETQIDLNDFFLKIRFDYFI
jgi:hypothetical protein